MNPIAQVVVHHARLYSILYKSRRAWFDGLEIGIRFTKNSCESTELFADSVGSLMKQYRIWKTLLSEGHTR